MKKLIALIQKPKLQLRWKLLGGFLTANLVLLVALGLAVLTLFGTTNTLDSLKTSNERSQLVLQMDALQNQMVSRALDYIWSGNLARLNEYEVLEDSLDRSVNSFKPTALQQANYTSLKQELKSLREVLDQMVKFDTANQEDEAQDLWRTQGSKQATVVRALIQELNQQENHNTQATYEQGETVTTSTAWLISALALVALLFGVGLALLFTAALAEPVRQLGIRLAKLAEGDLTQPVLIANGDELGKLGQTYNTTLTSLHQLISQLYTQSQQVNTATTELIAQAQNQVAGSSQQAEAITEATQSLQELNQTAEEIARQTLRVTQAVTFSLEQTQAVSGLTDEMARAYEEGRSIVARMVAALQKLKEQVANIEQQQQALVVQSGAIKGIVELSDSIAKETHLLALNASIEAAGAGEYGERFAVIAREVKNLADRSFRATGEVRTALGGIAQAIDNASESANQGLEEAEQAVREAGSSDKVLLDMAELTGQVKAAVLSIVGQVKDTALLASNIGVATRQQQSSSALMLEKMFEIEAVTTQNLNGVKQGETVTYQLNLSAQKLEASADAFKLAAN